MKKNTLSLNFWILFYILTFSSFGESQTQDSNGKVSSSQGQGQSPTAPHKSENQYYVLDEQETFCWKNPKVPFYQRETDGAVCCRGKTLPVITVQPETEGECAISTKFTENGLFDSDSLWCSYTCKLKKMGVIDRNGQVIPQAFLDHLSQGLTKSTKERIKKIMLNYLGCFKSLKNSDFPCYTPLGFQKCFQDALIYLCSNGMPKNSDFTKVHKVTTEYEKLKPFCYYNQRRVTPGCCHGKPLPWTITEILEAPRNEAKMATCLAELGDHCDASCLLKSLNVVNDDWELDVDKFQKKILNYFPMVKPSAWMDYTGPVFLFYDEVLVDMGDEVTESKDRVCRFHDRIMELHESKVEQYCDMTAAEVKEIVQLGSSRKK